MIPGPLPNILFVSKVCGNRIAGFVWRRFSDEVLSADVPLFTDLLSQRFHEDPLTLRSRVSRRVDLIVKAENDGETCLLRFSGRKLRLPAHVWPALQFATTADEFAVQDLPDCLDADGKLALVKRLVSEAILQRGEASTA